MATEPPSILSRLTPRDWVMAIGFAIQVGVVVWRVGAVERRLDTVDARLWQLARSGVAMTTACPPDATRVYLTAYREDPNGPDR